MPPLGAGLVGSTNALLNGWENAALGGGLSPSEKQDRLRPKLGFPDSWPSLQSRRLCRVRNRGGPWACSEEPGDRDSQTPGHPDTAGSHRELEMEAGFRLRTSPEPGHEELQLSSLAIVLSLAVII